jgi:two-component system, OmpR family, sensor kinase
VTPTLQSTMTNQKLGSLAEAADRYSGEIEASIGSNDDVRVVNRRVRAAADASGARVTLLGVTNGTYGLQTYIKYDSTAQVDIRDLDFAVAASAARTGRTALGTEAGDAGRIAEAAKPLFYRKPGSGRRVVGSIVVYSSPLNDVQQSVDSISRRILVAGGIALLVSILAGWLTARQFSRRVRRMERVAQRVAAGDFSARFERGSRDELGRLGRALDDMQRQLAELETARKSFIATASHELRTPIFSLGGFLELLQDEDLDDETRERFLGQLREQVDRLGKLATDLLDLSRLEAGSLDLRSEHTDVGELARDVAAEFTPALAAHESHLEVRLSAEPVEAVCDPERVAQIMRILIDNALNHTPAGTDVVLAASRRDGLIRLSVTDFGTGIKRGAMPRIFEPFYTSDDAQGSGLGLAIAHELAERMRGELSAESVPGRTTFALELPV